MSSTTADKQDDAEFEYRVITILGEQMGDADEDAIKEFPSIRDWLLHLSKNEKPDKEIDYFDFGLYVDGTQYILYVSGMKTYSSPGHSEHRIEFEPESTYFRLPESKVKQLSKEQVVEEITNDLISFTQSSLFVSSYFSKVKSLHFMPMGQFWPAIVSI